MTTGEGEQVAEHIASYRRSLAGQRPGQPLQTRAMSTSDLPLLVAAMSDTLVMRGYMQAPATWEPLVKRTTLPDTQLHHMYRLGGVSTFLPVPEGGQIQLSSVTERRETIQLTKYGRAIPWTYELMLGDRLNVLGDFATNFGFRAKLNETIRWFARLRLANAVAGRGPQMSDGVQFIAAAHSNLVAAGADPSVASIQATSSRRCSRRIIYTVASFTRNDQAPSARESCRISWRFHADHSCNRFDGRSLRSSIAW